MSMKQKFEQSIEATRLHFADKRCTQIEYFLQFEKELRDRNAGSAADKLRAEMKKQVTA